MSESNLLEALLQQPKRGYKEDAKFEPFHKIYSMGWHKRLDYFYMLKPASKRICLVAWDFENRRPDGKPNRISIVITQERLVKSASEILHILGEGEILPLDNAGINSLLEFYFKARRKKGSSIVAHRYVYREIINDVLRDGEVYAAQVSERYGMSFTNSNHILHEMENAKVLKRSRKLGHIVMFTFAIEKEDVISIIDTMVGFLRLKDRRVMSRA